MGDRGAELDVLLVEDSETETGLVIRELRRVGFAPVWQRVDSAEGLREALRRRPWHLVISDAGVSRLSALEALAVTRDVLPDVPFIVLSRATGEAEAIRAGDHVTRSDLAGLGAAVERELAQARAAGLEQSAISRRLLIAKEEERRRIARSLHDQFGQLLTALRLTLDDAQRRRGKAARERLDEALGLVDQAIQQVRDFYVDLWPTILDDAGLPAALRWLAERQARASGVAIDVDLEQIDRLPPALEAACFRVVQEALSNSARHADARRVDIRLRAPSGGLEVRVRDDGRGFDIQRAWQDARAGASLGLATMRERTALAGGQLEIDTAPGRGTTVRARFARSAS